MMKSESEMISQLRNETREQNIQGERQAGTYIRANETNNTTYIPTDCSVEAGLATVDIPTTVQYIFLLQYI